MKNYKTNLTRLNLEENNGRTIEFDRKYKYYKIKYK